MIVVDASALVDVLLGPSEQATWVDARRRGNSLHAPYLIDAEVMSALRRRVLRAEIGAPEARQMLDDFRVLRLKRYPQVHLIDRAWELRSILSTYDALYVALAEALDAPLVTTDAALARAGGHRARIETFPG